MVGPRYLDAPDPVERKVKAASSGAAVAGLVLWVLQVYVFAGDVPDPVVVAVGALVPAVVAWVAGYRAKHTPR